MSDSKIQIKIGNVEFSGEGNQDWIEKQLDKILEKASSIPASIQNNNSGIPAGGNLELSMVNIASKLNSKSGQDLATAAAAFLTYVHSKSTFSRDELLQSMKTATGFYKGTYVNNFTKILLALVKNNTLNQSSNNAYSLHVNKANELNAILSK